MRDVREPEVSIVIPAYNAEKYIVESVQSCLVQGERIETIVVDDGSTDATLDRLRPYQDHLKLLKSPSKGAPAARNFGLQHSRGRFVKFLDSDDALLDGAIKEQLDRARAHFEESREIPYGFAIEVNKSGERIGLRQSRPCGENENPFAHILRNSPITTCPLHPRAALMEVGGFEQSLPRGQEQDLHIRLVAAGYRFVFQDIPIYRYRQHGDGSNISGGMLTRYGKEVPRQYVQRFEKLAIDTYGEPLDSEIRLALAQMYWEAGRGVLREGASDVARSCFENSKRLHPQGVVGSAFYKSLVSIFSPLLAERWLQTLKSFRR